MNIVQSYECLNSCIVNAINYFGITLSSSDIFFLGNGLQIKYDNSDTPNIGAYLYESNFDFLDRYNYKYKHSYSNSFDSKRLIDDVLLKKKIISIKVSSTFLTYNRVFSQTSDSSHFVNIIGQDENNYYIVDGYVPTLVPSVFEGYVSKEEILRAWSAKNYEYVYIEEYKDISNVKDEANKCFFDSIDYYIYESKSTGIYSFLSMVDDIKKYIQEPNFRQIMLDINYKIKIYGYLTSKYYILEKIKENKNIN